MLSLIPLDPIFIHIEYFWEYRELLQKRLYQWQILNFYDFRPLPSPPRIHSQIRSDTGCIGYGTISFT